MSRHGCARCDWRPADEADEGLPGEQLLEHALGSGHPLCAVCRRSLEATELQSCARCVAEVRVALSELVSLCAMLPETLGHPKSPRMDPSRGGGDDETPLPGGDALAMMGPGSEGSQWRGRLRPSRLGSTPWRPVLRLRRDREGATVLDEANDNLAPDDPPAVAFLLGQWEDDWRKFRGETTAASSATVVGAVGYLSARLGWAGAHHPVFGEFAADVRGLHRRVESAVGASSRPEVGVACFDCEGAKLQREYGEEHYSCPRCHRIYLPQEYWLAVRAAAEQGKGRPA